MSSVIATIVVISVTLTLIFIISIIKFDESISPSGIRRHNGSNAVWLTAPYNAADLDDTVVIGVISPVEPARHSMYDELNEHDYTIEPHNSTGRHSVENHARTLVPSDWMPSLGNTRIALIDTPTSEYLIARKSKLRSRANDQITLYPQRTHTRLRDELVGPPTGYRPMYVPYPDMVNA